MLERLAQGLERWAPWIQRCTRATAVHVINGIGPEAGRVLVYVTWPPAAPGAPTGIVKAYGVEDAARPRACVLAREIMSAVLEARGV